MDKFPAKEFKNYPKQEEYKKGKWNRDNHHPKYTPPWPIFGMQQERET